MDLAEAIKPIRGKQRIAVYNALKHPRTGKQILEIVRESAPSITYQDLRHILRDFQKQGIVTCLNPECQTGRFYARPTTKEQDSSTEKVDASSSVARGKIRFAILTELGRERIGESKPMTATNIKKALRETYPMGLNHVIEGLLHLLKIKLVEVIDYTVKRDLKIYQITPFGRAVLDYVGKKETDSR
jgi:DNA-binding PadR family transcriptional regulator